MPHIHNIYDAEWKKEETARGGVWKYVDLSGERLGARIEELNPGDTSSVHHFHTSEEEHVLALEGNATLVLGSEKFPVKPGDHFWFAAGAEEAHHIENTSNEAFRFLVFGERNSHDVVVYPEHQVMLVKGLGFRQVTYRDVKGEEDD